VTESSQQDHSKHENDKEPYDIDAEMNKLRKYAAVKVMIFLSEEAAYYFYTKYAKEHGFSIGREKKKNDIDELGTPTIWYRRFLCSRAGTRESKYLIVEGRRYRHRPKSRCNGGAHLSVSFNRKKVFGVF
jgi:hypothetical protein